MKKNTWQGFTLLTLLIGLVTPIMIFLPALKFAGGTSSLTYTGLQVIMGVEVVGLGPVGAAVLPFSVMALIAFLLPLLAGLTAAILPKGFYVAAPLFITSAVLLFLLAEDTDIMVTILGVESILESQKTLLIGTIVAGGLSVAGALISIFAIMKKTKPLKLR